MPTPNKRVPTNQELLIAELTKSLNKLRAHLGTRSNDNLHKEIAHVEKSLSERP